MRSHPLLLAIATPLAEATVFTNSATLKTKVVEWVDNRNCCDAQIEDWDVSQITDMSGGGDAEGFDAEGFFPTDFNGDLSKWDTASVTTFERTVRVARSVAPRAFGQFPSHHIIFLPAKTARVWGPPRPRPHRFLRPPSEPRPCALRFPCR